MEKVVLLADKNSKAWDFAEKIKQYIQYKEQINVPLKEVSINHFRNKEIDMHIPENIRKKDVYFIQDSAKNPQQWWIELLLLKDLLLNASVESLSFILPNMLYSRKDRKEKSRVPISARALANSISPGLKRIITMDLHAAQIQGFYPAHVPVDNLYSFPEAVRYLTQNPSNSLKNLVVVSPDSGGVERAESFAKRLKSKYPIALIDKRRIEAGEIKEMRLVGDVKDKDVLIVDDIIDSGNTLCEAAKLLKEKGAKNLFCYATHGLFTLGTEELSKYFNKIMTSNTNYNIQSKGIEIIDVSPVFAEAIYRAQKGISISELFK